MEYLTSLPFMKKDSQYICQGFQTLITTHIYCNVSTHSTFVVTNTQIHKLMHT